MYNEPSSHLFVEAVPFSSEGRLDIYYLQRGFVSVNTYVFLKSNPTWVRMQSDFVGLYIRNVYRGDIQWTFSKRVCNMN